jgi:hypothetical protein
MTRGEAIQILSTRDWSGMLCGYTSGYVEALDMAIKALEMQNNCIICPRCGREFSEYEGREQTNDE